MTESHDDQSLKDVEQLAVEVVVARRTLEARILARDIRIMQAIDAGIPQRRIAQRAKLTPGQIANIKKEQSKYRKVP